MDETATVIFGFIRLPLYPYKILRGRAYESLSPLMFVFFDFPIANSPLISPIYYRTN